MKYLLRQKLFLASLAGLVLAGIGILAMKPVERHDPPPAQAPLRSFDRTLAGSGLIEPSTENISIGTPLGGIVEDVVVEVGQRVSKGDPLFRLDTRHLQAQADVAKAAIAAAESRVAVNTQLLADLRDQLERIKKLEAGRVVSTDEKNRIGFAHEAAAARLGEAEADVQAARAQLQVVLTDIERSLIRSPIDAKVLQVKVRKGEYAPAGATRDPLLLLGGTGPLRVRVDIDETDATRISPTAAATGQLRGEGSKKIPLRFVRFEPFVVPKRSLTGDSAERVDTRVLQCIYEIERSNVPMFIGQQMDVFIEETPVAAVDPR
jgi:RND family efflux transporter MFP subunit